MPYDQLTKGRVSIPGQIYFVTAAIHQRKPILADLRCARIVINTLREMHDRDKIKSLSWVVMPDHLHWLFQLGEGHSLANVIQSTKGRSAKRINEYLGYTGSVWQKGFYDYALRSEDDIKGVARYIVANPLRARLVEHIGNYSHWDAVWL